MIAFSTKRLREIVAPDDLEAVLDALAVQGLIKYYMISAATVCIEVTKNAEIGALLKEEGKQRPNPRPYVNNKVTKK